MLRSECLPHTVLEGGMEGTRMHGRQDCYVDRLNEEQQCGIWLHKEKPMTQKTGITVGLDLPEQAEHSRRIHYAITLTVSADVAVESNHHNYLYLSCMLSSKRRPHTLVYHQQYTPACNTHHLFVMSWATEHLKTQIFLYVTLHIPVLWENARCDATRSRVRFIVINMFNQIQIYENYIGLVRNYTNNATQ